MDLWFLLEYRGHWSKSAFGDAKIPKKVKRRIKSQLSRHSKTRLQLIKQTNPDHDGIKFYICVSDDSKPRTYEFEVADYRELLSLNLKSILKHDHHLREKPLVLVCTNGEYDKCCGTYGVPMYLDLNRKIPGDTVWQTTHIGGHRFAATFVCLPHGIYNGHLNDPTELDRVVEMYSRGHIDPRYYRGRSCYDPYAQAAEYYLRTNSDITDIGAFRLKGVKKHKGHRRVNFRSTEGDTTHQLTIKLSKKSVKVIKNCGDKKPSSVGQYELVKYNELSRIKD